MLAEVLAAYVPLRRSLKGNDLARMVRVARSTTGARLKISAEEEHELALRLGNLVTGVLRRLPTDSRCLIRSLVLTRMLSARSIESRIVIGVSDDGGFGAHAWVEHDGRALLPVGSFARLTEL